MLKIDFGYNWSVEKLRISGVEIISNAVQWKRWVGFRLIFSSSQLIWTMQCGGGLRLKSFHGNNQTAPTDSQLSRGFVQLFSLDLSQLYPDEICQRSSFVFLPKQSQPLLSSWRGRRTMMDVWALHKFSKYSKSGAIICKPLPTVLFPWWFIQRTSYDAKDSVSCDHHS